MEKGRETVKSGGGDWLVCFLPIQGSRVAQEDMGPWFGTALFKALLPVRWHVGGAELPGESCLSLKEIQ